MVIIFDLDGTLLDTFDVIKHTYMDVFDNHLKEFKYTEEDIKSYFGPPLIDTLMKATNNDVKKSKELEKYYMEYSVLNHYKYLKLFSNSDIILKILKSKGYKIAINSNKVREHIDLGLKITGLSKYIDFIVGLDEVLNPKPHPEGIFKIKENLNEENCLFVGDTIIDIKTAKNANVKAVGVTWAFTDKLTHLKNGADYTIDDFLELLDILED